MHGETYNETKLQKQILALQNQMMIAIENSEIIEAYELEKQIDDLQAQLIRLKGE